jgi:hypothetical protein
MYQPKPIDTAHVGLPAGVADLVERLAEHNHDIWAQQRFAAGWTYGPQRDDAKKQNPDLVPYAELPESEKEYDGLATDWGQELKSELTTTMSKAVAIPISRAPSGAGHGHRRRGHRSPRRVVPGAPRSHLDFPRRSRLGRDKRESPVHHHAGRRRRQLKAER